MFAERLKLLRTKAGLSQRDLAQEIGVSTRTVINYENGRCIPRSGDVLTALAKKLQVSTDYLLQDRGAVAEFSREEGQAEQLVSQLAALFAGGMLNEADRDAAMQALTQAYWDGKRLAAESEARNTKA